MTEKTIHKKSEVPVEIWTLAVGGLVRRASLRILGLITVSDMLGAVGGD